jgi:hypothetical protein
VRNELTLAHAHPPAQHLSAKEVAPFVEEEHKAESKKRAREGEQREGAAAVGHGGLVAGREKRQRLLLHLLGRV